MSNLVQVAVEVSLIIIHNINQLVIATFSNINKRVRIGFTSLMSIDKLHSSWKDGSE